MRMFMVFFSMVLAGSARGAVVDIEITPSFETAGVILTTDADPDNASIVVGVKEAGSDTFQRVHDPVRFDARHLATSLFDLEGATAYELQVDDGSTSRVESFVTRAEPTWRAPVRTVSVSTTEELAAAFADARAGDEILVAPGRYTGGLVLSRSGTENNPIVIRGDVPDATRSEPVQDRDGLPVIEDSSDWGLVIAASWVIVEHLRVENNSGGIRLRDAHRCTVRGCQIYDNGSSWNILISRGGAGFHLLEDNHVADLVSDTPYGPSTGGDDSVTYYGIKQDDAPGPGTVMRRNVVQGHYDGIIPCGDEEDTQDVSESSTDVLGSWNNHNLEVYENVVFDQRDDNIEADGICVNARIFRNHLGRAHSPISVAPALPGPYFFLRNVGVDFSGSAVKLNTRNGRGTIRNIYFYHNTFLRTDTTGDYRDATLYLWDGTPSQDITFRNNLFVGNHWLVTIQTERVHDPDMDYSLWYSPEGPEAELFIWWGGGHWKVGWDGWKDNTGNDAHGVWGDPQLDMEFVPTTSDSPAVDHGLVIPGISDVYADGGPDIGARELGLATSHPIVVDPTDPIDPVDPTDPIDPTDPDPIGPTDPTDPEVPIESDPDGDTGSAILGGCAAQVPAPTATLWLCGVLLVTGRWRRR